MRDDLDIEALIISAIKAMGYLKTFCDNHHVYTYIKYLIF